MHAQSSQPGESGQDKTLTIGIDDADGATIVALSGELDLGTIPRMEGPLLEQLQRGTAVLVDLSGLSFIDSSGIGALIQANRSADGTPVSFLIEADSQVDRVFKVAGIGDAMPVFTDRGEALDALR